MIVITVYVGVSSISDSASMILLLVNRVDCKSQCNMSVSGSGLSPSQSSAAETAVSLESSGFIQVDRSPSGRCPHQQSCAVTLRAEPGQRINVTLWDFTMRDDQRVVARHKTHGVETCYRYKGGAKKVKDRGKTLLAFAE